MHDARQRGQGLGLSAHGLEQVGRVGYDGGMNQGCYAALAVGIALLFGWVFYISFFA